MTTSNQQVSDTSAGGDYRSSSSGCSCTCSADEISFPSLSAGEETQESASILSSQRLQPSHQSRDPEAGEQDDSPLARVDILTSSDDQGIRSPSLVNLDKRNLIGCAENGNRTHHSDVTAGAEKLSDKTESHSNDSPQLGVVELCSQVHISSNSIRFVTGSSDSDSVSGQTLEDKVLRLRQEMRIVEEKIDHARRSFAERQQQTEALNKLLSLLRRQELLRTVQRLRMQLARQTTRLQTHSQNLRKLSPTCSPSVRNLESDPFA